MDDMLHPDRAGGLMANNDSPAGRVLLVDDEPAFQRLGGAWLRNLGHHVSIAGDAAAAIDLHTRLRPDVVLLDLSMPPRMDPHAGLELIPLFAPSPVIVLTGHADHSLALEAADKGAWDFIAKPVDPDLLRVVVARAVRKARLDAELRDLRLQVSAEDLGMAGTSPAMARLRDLVRRVGPASVSVVILGPTGTGKELVARALHACGPRGAGPFVPVHCGGLPADLLESELFGHLKGSFTGAHRDQPGLLETANRGTLFLDEVGEMPAPMQVKLLRFLQEGTFLPVGGRAQRRADVRVVAATHRDLEAMVAAGTFREDLFYRLKGVVLRTPPLAERAEDVALLAALFARRAALPRPLAADALAWLAARDWPGNVRELRSVVEVAAALAADGATAIDADMLRFATGEQPVGDAPVAQAVDGGTLDAAVAELETRMLRDALAAANGNQSEAARRLGISRVGLIKKLARLGLKSAHGAARP
jgi:two-component system NtrC family response regulator